MLTLDLTNAPRWHDLAAGDLVGDAVGGHELRRVGLQLLQEDALGRDLAQGLPVRRARHRQRHRHRLGIEDIPAHQHRPQAKHVIRRFTIHQRSLTGGVGVYHPAQGGAVAGGELRRKEVTIGFKKLV